MKLCQKHWDMLREAIEQRGLSHLVAKNGEEAAKMLAAQAQGDVRDSNYDPLMSANFAIWSQALNAFGLAMMAPDAPCPLCHKNAIETACTDPHCSKQTGDQWVGFAADEQLQYARHKGLVPKEN